MLRKLRKWTLRNSNIGWSTGVDYRQMFDKTCKNARCSTTMIFNALYFLGGNFCKTGLLTARQRKSINRRGLQVTGRKSFLWRIKREKSTIQMMSSTWLWLHPYSLNWQSVHSRIIFVISLPDNTELNKDPIRLSRCMQLWQSNWMPVW